MEEGETEKEEEKWGTKKGSEGKLDYVCGCIDL
jgi:hypothetical protein